MESRNNLPVLGLEAIQPVASHYTFCAILTLVFVVVVAAAAVITELNSLYEDLRYVVW
jgi:hypothetical protein